MRPAALPSPAPPTLATLWCFGAGTNGQLATGQLQDSHTAVLLNLEHPSRIAASAAYDSEILPAGWTCSCNHTASATVAADADASSHHQRHPVVPAQGSPPAAPAAVGEEEVVKVSCGGNHVVVWWAPRKGFADNLAGKMLQGDPTLPHSADFVGWTWGLDVAGCGEGHGKQERRAQEQNRVPETAVSSTHQSEKLAPEGRLGQAPTARRTGDYAPLPAQDVAGGALRCAPGALGTTHTTAAPAPAGCAGAAAKVTVARAACDDATVSAGGAAAVGMIAATTAVARAVPTAGEELVVEADGDGGVLVSPRRIALPPTTELYGIIAGGSLATAAAAPRVQQVACGWEHTVFLTASGEVLVAGRGGRGQLGLGPNATAATRPRLLPLPLLPTGWRVNSVAAGMWHTLLAATAPCAAANVDAATTATATVTPAEANMHESGGAVAAATVAGDQAPSTPAAAVVAAVYGFGSNRRLQLGDLCVGTGGDVGRHAAAAANAIADAATAVVAAVASSGAMDTVTSGTVYGSSGAASLGWPAARVPASPSPSSSSSSRCACVWYPALVHLEEHRGAAPLQVYGGGDHSAFLDTAGRLFVWGRALSGFEDTPGVPAGGLATPAQPEAPHGSARRTFPRPRDCGTPTQVLVPLPRPARLGAAASEGSAFADATAVTSARAASVAAADGGAAAHPVLSAVQSAATRDAPPAAGSSSFGRRGELVATSAQSKARVWRQMALGWHHAVALDSAGQVWAWGSNRHGQLARLPPGSPTRPQGHTSPDSNPLPQAAAATVPDRALPAAAVAAAVVVESPVPLPMSLPAVATCVAAGSEHCAAVLQDGRVFTWGWGEHGQLGQGDEESRWVPERVILPSVGADVPGCGPGLGASANPVAVACCSVACGAGFTVCVQRPG